MPNWCYTTYHFHGKHNDLAIFRDKIIEWTSTGFTKTDFGDPWLGNILHGAGLQERIDNADLDKRLSCRGTMMDISEVEKDNILEVYTETAWVPMGKMWQEVIKVLGLDIGFAFEAEEPGCNLFWIYDPKNYGDFDEDKIYLDVDLGDGVYFSEYTTEEGALESLNKALQTNAPSLAAIDVICEEYMSEHEDSFIRISEFEKITRLDD